MGKSFEQRANQIVTTYTTKKTLEAKRKLDQAVASEKPEEVISKLVKDLNTWIAFLDLADSYPRYMLVNGQIVPKRDRLTP